MPVPRHPEAARKVAVMLYMIRQLFGVALAVMLFEATYNTWVAAERRVRSVDAFILRWGEHFFQHGHVREVAHGGWPRRVPDGVAMEAAVIVKSGYWTYSFSDRSGRRHLTHQWWPNISSAVSDNHRLQEICSGYDITPDRLLAYMQAIDPTLVMRKRHFKVALTSKQKYNRMDAAQVLLALHLSDATLLPRAVWIDECKIRLSSMARGEYRVLCDAYDEEVDEVMPCSWLAKGQDITLAIIMAVNARVGVLYWDWCTGTTDIQRQHLPQAIQFHVSACSAMSQQSGLCKNVIL